MLDLFSGIGGFSLAANWTGCIHTKAFCEKDRFCQRVLKKNFGKDITIYNTIEEMDARQYLGAIDIVTGGFPCQPFSVAGKQRGKDDNRYLWPEMFRVIKESQPAWVVGENVANIINLALDTVLSDLESENYETQSFVIPAAGAGAPHKRDRVWIVAYSNNARLQRYSKRHDLQRTRGGHCVAQRLCANVANPTFAGYKEWESESPQIQSGGRSGWLREPELDRVAHGISNRVHRVKGLGNAIVPQVVFPILNGIVEIENV